MSKCVWSWLLRALGAVSTIIGIVMVMAASVKADSVMPDSVIVAAAPKDKLLIGTNKQLLQPYNCVGERSQGCIFSEVTQKILDIIGFDYEFISVTEPRKFMGMAAGDLDAAIIFTTKYLLREQYPETVMVCEVPIVRSSLSAFSRDGVKIETINDLKNYHLIAMRLPQFQRGMLGTNRFKSVTRTVSLDLMMKMVVAGRGDFFVFETYSGLKKIKELNFDGQIHLGAQLVGLNYHFALSHIGMRKHPRLIKMCDLVKEMSDSGALQGIIDKHQNKMSH